MWHKPCRTFHPWCPCFKTRCLCIYAAQQRYELVPRCHMWSGPVHYSDVIMGEMASQITSLRIVYSTVYSGKGQRKHQSSASLAFLRGIHRWPVNSPHKGPVTRTMFPFDDIIMRSIGKLEISQLSVSMTSWMLSKLEHLRSVNKCNVLMNKAFTG